VTDPELVHRAEQAYLGALLARQVRAGTGTIVAGDAGPGALGGLRPQDFADPVHQAVYAAVAGQVLPARRGLPAIYERLRGMLTRLLSARARAAADYMGGLPGLCPDPDNMAAYAAMVTEASQARPARASASVAPTPPPARAPQQPTNAENARLASAAQWLDGNRTGRRQAGGTRQTEPAYAVPPSRAGRAPDGLDRQTARLARALSAEARRRAHRVSPPAVPSPVDAGERAAPLSAGALQEQVLADLMLHPAGRGDITSWLPATVFAAGSNRTLYELISARLQRGRPVGRPRRRARRAPGRRSSAPRHPEPSRRHRRRPRPAAVRRARMRRLARAELADPTPPRSGAISRRRARGPGPVGGPRASTAHPGARLPA